MIKDVKSAVGRIAHRVVNGLTQQSTAIADTDTYVAPELVELCRATATEGVVLLRNDDVLPLGAALHASLIEQGMPLV